MAGTDDPYIDIAELYDQCPSYRDRDDVDFYVEQAVSAGGRILELGCGTGRILLPIARAGCSITGLDVSEKMLDVCRKKLAAEKEDTKARVKLIKADMRNFCTNDSYSLVIIPFRAFQHLLTAKDQLDCLASIRNHTAPGGRLILDLFNPSMKYILDESRRREFGEEEPYGLQDGRTVTRRFRNPSVDLAEQTMDCRIVYYIENPDGSSDEAVQAFRLRYIFRFEAEHLLERAGFEVIGIYGDYRQNPFGHRWPGELVLVAAASTNTG